MRTWNIAGVNGNKLSGLVRVIRLLDDYIISGHSVGKADATVNPEPSTVNPEPSTVNPEPRTVNPEPRTSNLEP
jgi:hypothetical protein